MNLSAFQPLRFTFAVAAVAMLIPSSHSQPPINPNHVTFYSEPNFQGEAFIVEAGASVPDLSTLRRTNQRPWTWAISSVLIEGAARASVYTGPNFAGERLDLTTSVSDLYAIGRAQVPGATWDRCIVSVVVHGPRSVTPPPPPPTVVYQTPVAPPPPPTTIYVAPQPAPPPPVVEEIRPRMSMREADEIIEQAFREVLDRPADPPGLRTYRERLMRDGWSQMQIIQQLQRSDEARRIKPDEAITKMYHEILGRDPDPNGMAHYRSLWRDGWTQGAMKADLAKSAEARNYWIRSTITRAYKELLNREPDPEGYATYERLMRDKGYTAKEIRSAIMSGDEYRKLHPRGR